MSSREDLADHLNGIAPEQCSVECKAAQIVINSILKNALSQGLNEAEAGDDLMTILSPDCAGLEVVTKISCCDPNDGKSAEIPDGLLQKCRHPKGKQWLIDRCLELNDLKMELQVEK